MVQPGEGALDDPAFRHDLKGMEFATLDHFDLGADEPSDIFGEVIARVTAVYQDFAHFRQVRVGIADEVSRAVAVGHIGGANERGMGQAAGVHADVKLYPGSFFPAS